MGRLLALGRAVLHGAAADGHERFGAGFVRRVTRERALGVVLRTGVQALLCRGAVLGRVAFQDVGAALLLRARVAGRLVVDLCVHAAIGGGGFVRGIPARAAAARRARPARSAAARAPARRCGATARRTTAAGPRGAPAARAPVVGPGVI